MIIILLVVALFFLAELLFPARAENGGELMFPEPESPRYPHSSDCSIWCGEPCDCVTGCEPEESDLEMARRLR